MAIITLSISGKMTLYRADPEAVTEENPDTPLRCAWLNDHEAAMHVLAEVSAVPMEIQETLLLFGHD